MKEKYEWALECSNIINYESINNEIIVDDNGKNIISARAKHAFWSFLQAYQQIRFYHGKWMKEKGLHRLANLYVDKWRTEYITLEQSRVFGLLSQIRNIDTHDEPAFPTLHVKHKVLLVNGKALLLNGKLVELRREKTIEIKVGNRFFELTNVVNIGLECMEIFINTFDEINEPLNGIMPQSHSLV